MARILIIGEDPAYIDFDAPDAPEGVTPDKIHAGLDASRDNLSDQGHPTDILLIRDATTVEAQLAEAVGSGGYEVIVVGAGLRTLPPMAESFELLMNAIRREAPAARLAFNSSFLDSHDAARRWLDRD